MPLSSSELEWLEMEQEKEPMLAAMNESLRDFNSSQVTTSDAREAKEQQQLLLDNAGQPQQPVPGPGPALTSLSKDGLYHNSSNWTRRQPQSIIDTYGKMKEEEEEEEEEYMSELEWLQMEQEEEMILSAMNESLRWNEATATTTKELAPSIAVQQPVSSQVQQPASEVLAAASTNSTSRTSIRTQAFVEEEQEREMLELAYQLSLQTSEEEGEDDDNKKEPTTNVHLVEEDCSQQQQQQPKAAAATATRPSIRTLVFAKEAQENEMLEMAVRLSLADNNNTNNDNNSGSRSLANDARDAVVALIAEPEEEEEEDISYRTNQPMVVGPSSTTAGSYRPSIRTYRLLIEENEREMLEVAMERSLRDQHDDDNDDDPALAQRQEEEDDEFDILQVVRFRSGQAAADGEVHYCCQPRLPLQHNNKPSPSVMSSTARPSSVTAQTMPPPEAMSVRGQTTRTRTSSTIRAPSGKRNTVIPSPTTTTATTTTSTPSLLCPPQGKEDDFHVMQIVQERARQAATEEATTLIPPLKLQKQQQPEHQQQTDEESLRFSSSSGSNYKKEQSSSLLGTTTTTSVRPGAYSGIPGKGMQRTNPIRFSLVGLASNRK